MFSLLLLLLLLLLTENRLLPGVNVPQCKTGQYNTESTIQNNSIQYITLHYITITHITQNNVQHSRQTSVIKITTTKNQEHKTFHKYRLLIDEQQKEPFYGSTVYITVILSGLG